MVSIAVHGGHTPHDVLHDVVDWGRVVVATAARAVVATLLGLALWSAAPALLGWHPTTVMTGSMAPRLAPGDVVVSRPVASAEIRPGQILLADDPDQPGHLRMHRFVEPGPDGTVVTKGDANPQVDSTPIERSAVHGVGFLRVPSVATPVLWVREGRWVEVGTVALALVAVLLLCTVDAPLRRRGPRHRGDGGHAGSGGPTGDGREARLASAGQVPRGAHAPAHRTRRTSHSSGVVRRGVVAGLAVIVTGAAAVTAGPAQAAPFGRTTGTLVGLTAGVTAKATALTCRNANGSVVIGWSYSGDVPRSFSVLDTTDGTVLATTTSGTASAQTVQLSGLLGLGVNHAVKVQTNDLGSWTATSTESVPVKLVTIAGIGTGTSCGP